MWRRTIVLLCVDIPIALYSLRPEASDVDLPAGPMQETVRTACLECHDADIIVQQRLSKAAWTNEVDKMAKCGALVNASDHDDFVEYLSVNFSPDKPVYVAARTPPRTSSK